jgi:hypothetical protein
LDRGFSIYGELLEVFYPYSDATDFPAKITCYSINEILAKKLVLYMSDRAPIESFYSELKSALSWWIDEYPIEPS